MIIRCPHESNYTVLNNELINDFKLDWKDLGLLVYLLSKPESWEISVPHLAKIRKSGRDSIYKSLNNLINIGYAKRITLKTGHVNWLISEVKKPVLKPFTEKPETVVNKPFTENPEMGAKNPVDPASKPFTENPETATHSRPIETSVGPVLKPFTEKPFTEKPDVLVSTEVYKVLNKSNSSSNAREENQKSAAADDPIEIPRYTDGKNSDPKTWEQWQEFFVNEKGFSFAEAQSLGSMTMYRKWVEKGITRDDVEIASTQMLNKGKTARYPAFYESFVEEVIQSKNKPLNHPDKPRKADANKPIVPLWTGHKPAPKINNDEYFAYIEKQYGKTGCAKTN